jgi:hypothetical protein
VEAQAVVAADKPAAFPALPFFLLVSEEGLNATFFGVGKVSHHAHVVVSTITLVDMLDLVTGESAAPVTILPAVFFQLEAVFDPAASATFILICIIIPASRTLLFFPQIGGAQGAVHAAGGDEFFSQKHKIIIFISPAFAAAHQ